MRSQSKYILNIAATCVGTRVLGPGLRSVVWVQGCPFHCIGCISPQWIPNKTARLMPVDSLVTELLADPKIDGFTFSGGEPFSQADSLSELIRLARLQRDLSLICYSGYLLDDLINMKSLKGIGSLLSQIDVLIDGQYIRDLNDNRGLRGSSNQQIHYLTDRIKDYDFQTQPRQAEIHISDGEMLFVGVPPKGIIPRVVHNVHMGTRRVKEAYEWT